MKIVVIAAVVGAAGAVAPAGAQTRPGFEIGAELVDHSYRERQEGEVVVREDGLFGGGSLSYVETIGSGVFLRARLSVAVGSADYVGSGAVLGSIEGESRLDGITQSLGQLELHLGKDFVLPGGATVTPFVGLGSRYFRDESGGEVTDDGLLGYDREVSFGYVPLGIAGRIPLGGNGGSLTLSGQYNWVVEGEAESKFSGIDPALPDVTVDLDGGHGFEFSALGTMPVGRNAINFGPFVRYWKLNRSESFVVVDPEGSGESIELFEPGSRRTELGLKVSFSF